MCYEILFCNHSRIDLFFLFSQRNITLRNATESSLISYDKLLDTFHILLYRVSDLSTSTMNGLGVYSLSMDHVYSTMSSESSRSGDKAKYFNCNILISYNSNDSLFI